MRPNCVCIAIHFVIHRTVMGLENRKDIPLGKVAPQHTPLTARDSTSIGDNKLSKTEGR